MRSIILKLVMVSLCVLVGSAANAQEPPRASRVEPVTEACPAATAVTRTVTATRVDPSLNFAPARMQDPPPAPPTRPVPQITPRPAPKPDKTKVKVKVRDQEEPEDPEAPEDEEPPQTDQTVAATPTVIVSFCGGASNVIVRGWDRNEVHASIDGGESIELKSYSTGDEHAPASKIEVMITSITGRQRRRLVNCHSTGDVRLDVPRGAVLDLKTNQGDIEAENIARFRAQSLGGSIVIRNVAKSVDATSFNGDLTVEKTKGPLSLNSISGDIEVRDVEQADAGDGLSVKSISGEVFLTNCKFGRVEGSSVSGDLNWNGALSNGGLYKFSNTNGEIIMVMPANSSFRVNAQTALEGAVSTDFALRSQGETSFDQIARSVRGVYGTGSAQLELTTFNGSIRLRKK